MAPGRFGRVPPGKPTKERKGKRNQRGEKKRPHRERKPNLCPCRVEKMRCLRKGKRGKVKKRSPAPRADGIRFKKGAEARSPADQGKKKDGSFLSRGSQRDSRKIGRFEKTVMYRGKGFFLRFQYLKGGERGMEQGKGGNRARCV